MKNIRTTFAVIICLLLSACPLEVPVPTSGSVTTNSGSMNCAAGTTCSLDVTDIHFDETFVAHPAPGFVFDSWQSGSRRLCGDQAGDCQFSTATLEGNEAAIALFSDPDQVLYIEPRFLSTGFKVLITGNSFVNSIAFAMPNRAAAAGVANHNHNQVTSGGISGTPQALWNNATKGPQIRGILDEGDVDIFTMLPDTMAAYRLWIDYALAQNPNTRIALKMPWVPSPATRSTTEYATFTANFHAGLHADVDALRSEYPGVEIFCLPYADGAVMLRELFDAGDLEGITVLTGGAATAIYTDAIGHAGNMLKELSRLIMVRSLYDVDMTTYAFNPPFTADLKSMAQQITDAHDPAYDALYR